MGRRQRLVVAYLLVLAGLTALRVPVWRSDLTLWADAVIGSAKPRAWANLGTARLELGDVVGATAAYDRARALVAHPARERERRLVLATIQASGIYVALARGDVAEARRVAFAVTRMFPGWDVGQTLCAGVRCDQP